MKARTTSSPRIGAFRLPPLTEGDPEELGSEATLDGVRFTNLDVTGIDLSGSTFSECEVDGLRARDAGMRGVRIVESVVRGLDVPVLRAARSTWRDVILDGGRVGSAELYDSSWSSVRITGCKLGFINLRSSKVLDVLFEDCTIDELDLGGATVARIAFRDSSLKTLDVQGARLQDVDLRGLEFDRVSGVDSLAPGREHPAARRRLTRTCATPASGDQRDDRESFHHDRGGQDIGGRRRERRPAPSAGRRPAHRIFGAPLLVLHGPSGRHGQVGSAVGGSGDVGGREGDGVKHGVSWCRRASRGGDEKGREVGEGGRVESAACAVLCCAAQGTARLLLSQCR